MGAAAVSVVIAARDAADTIGDALASLRDQTHAAWEAVVVENGSVDHTSEAVAASAAGDPRIRLIHVDTVGVSAARNAGIKAATHDWLLFLDADDVLLPDALAVLVDATGEADAAWGGWIRRSVNGDELAEHPRRSEHNLFGAFARRCVFATHCCVVRRALVQEVGGFDTRLVTCEDWDLWQRIARTGARFAMVDGHHAVYRIRPGSASADPARLLADAMTVIARGHDCDPRVARADPAHAAGRPASEAHGAALTFALYAAGIALAKGDEPIALLEAVPDRGPAILDPLEVAHHLFAGALSHASDGAAAWLRLRATGVVAQLLTTIERRSRSPQLSHRALRRLDRLIAEHTGAPVAGSLQTVDVDLEEQLADIAPAAGVERVIVRAAARGHTVGSVELPVCADVIPVGVVADALAAAHAWTIAEVFFGPQELDWDLFLGALLGRRDLPPDGAYAESTEWAATGPAGRDAAGRAVAEVSELPVAPPADGEPVVVTCAGVPLGVLPASPADAGALVRAILTACGYELCRAAVREGLIGRTWNAPLRELLRAGSGVPPSDAAGPALLGRREPTSFGGTHSRRAVIPRAAASDLVAMAKAAGEPVVGDGLAYVPEDIAAKLPPPIASGYAPAAGRRSVRHDFEALFARGENPWRYDSGYERGKYEQTLELIGDGPVSEALELGCAEGHFTVRLAPRVESLTAVDVSSIALERASRLCSGAGFGHVRLVRLDIAQDDLPGPVDLVVCSEILYYAGDRETLERVATKIKDALRPGGILVHAHAHALVDDPAAPGFDWGVPFGAQTIGETLARTAGLRLEAEVETDYYRVQRLRRTRRRLTRQRSPVRRRGRAVEPPDEVARHFRLRGGQPRPVPSATRTDRVPILMYHRVAAMPRPGGERWCVAPEAFAEQIGYLADAGYRTVELEEWLHHANGRAQLPGRPIAITFDDGDAEFAEQAWPVLRRNGFGAVVLLPTDYVGSTSAWDEAYGLDVPLLGWDDARALEAEGVRFGSHTAGHVPLPGVSLAEAAGEMARARERLHRELDSPIDAIAYPFGDVDEGIEHLAGACGYAFGLTCRHGAATLTDAPMRLPRIEVTGSDGLEAFVGKLA